MLRFRVLLGGILIAAAVLALSGCAPDGNQIAAGYAQQVIDDVGASISPAYPRPRPADFLAASALESGPSRDAQLDVLDWSGDSGDVAGAHIVFRVHVDVAASYPSTFERGHVAGSATRCWELTVYGTRNYDTLETRGISCPPDAVARTPMPAPLPAFPDDFAEKLTVAMTSATSDDVGARVQAAFPEDYYSIGSDEQGRVLVVALGIPSEYLCELGVRLADGTVSVEYPGKMIPGEQNCSPEMYFHPVITH
ncbi:MAG: hypothetical protein ABJA94_07085 [Rhodoglobus sp.]